MSYEKCRVYQIDDQTNLCGLKGVCRGKEQFATDIAHSTNPNYTVRMTKEQLQNKADQYAQLDCQEIDQIRQLIQSAFP